MPTLVNGHGQWYFGRRNIHEHTSTCEFCGAYTTLRSYDSTLFLTAYYLPIFPLAINRITDHCPQCNRYHTMRRGHWKRQRAKAIGDALNTYRENTRDAKSARALIGVCAYFEDEVTFLVESEEIERMHSRDAGVASILARAYSFFNYKDAAISSIERALVLRDTVEGRHFAVSHYLHLQQPEMAHVHLMYVSRLTGQCDIRLLWLTLRELQSQRMYAQGIELIEEAQSVDKKIRDNAGVGMTLGQLQKAIKTGEPPLTVDASPPQPLGGPEWNHAVAWLFSSVIIAACITVIYFALRTAGII